MRRPSLSGFSIVELMISAVLAALIAASAFYILQGQVKSVQQQGIRLKTDQDSLRAQVRISRDIEAAGFQRGKAPLDDTDLLVVNKTIGSGASTRIFRSDSQMITIQGAYLDPKAPVDGTPIFVTYFYQSKKNPLDKSIMKTIEREAVAQDGTVLSSETVLADVDGFEIHYRTGAFCGSDEVRYDLTPSPPLLNACATDTPEPTPNTTETPDEDDPAEPPTETPEPDDPPIDPDATPVPSPTPCADQICSIEIQWQRSSHVLPTKLGSKTPTPESQGPMIERFCINLTNRCS
ncbi:MAG: hypothetical protein V1495_09635 [Pseudomonadota bacterium]